ncbi:MAG TPA: magnesium transporter [Verrucomicrobiae bacterium]|nr:magnesium transporter [Verrucomicrobiae bacterium]
MFKETTIAYSFDIAGLIAGFLISYQLNVFRLAPWTFALYPALISIRIINGLLSGRLSTALHLGTIYPRFSRNTKSFHELVHAVIVLTLATSLAVSLISLFFGYLLLGITVAEFPAIVSVMVSTLAIGLLFSSVTIKVAFVSFKRGLDPDIVVYPIISTTAIIFVTLCYIGVLNLFFFLPFFGRLAILSIGLAHVFLVLYLVFQDKQEPEFLKTIRESFIMLIFVAVILTLTGTVFKGISNAAENRKEIYTIYPALIDMVSDVGSVVGSTANTKLALGLLTPSMSSIKNHTKNITSAWTASLLISTILALISLAINRVFSLSSVLNFVLIIWVSNIIAVIAIVLLSYAIAILTFRRGLNPDNFVIPIETSLAIIVTSIALLLALFLIL